MGKKETNVMGCAIASLIGMTLGCLFMLVSGIMLLTEPGEQGMGFLGAGFGFWGLIGCIALAVVMIRQNRPGAAPENKLQWETGVLTDQVIKKDLYALRKTRIIGYFAVSVILGFSRSGLSVSRETRRLGH